MKQKEGDTDVVDSQKFNVGLKTEINGIHRQFVMYGGKIEIMDAQKWREIAEKGTFTYTSVKAGAESLVKELPSAYTYVESGLNQYAATAKSKSAGRH